MNSHFSVILLCFSSVYCMSSTIENLDLNQLIQILSGETTIKEWETTIHQDIYYGEDEYGNKITVNVKHALDNFVQQVNNGDETEFETIRNIITRAYQCTLAKYASLTAFMILQDMNALRINFDNALNAVTRSHDRNFFKEFHEISGRLYHLDFDFEFQGKLFQYLSYHDFKGYPSNKWHNVLAAIIEKKLGFKIKYKIYPVVLEEKFPNNHKNPNIKIFNHFACVINEIVQLFDKFIVENCVQHGGSFLMNFQSLEKGINEDVIRLTKHLDKMIARGSTWALYKDYSIPGPGTSQAFDEIRASGGFVENVEFKISDFKIDFKNNADPTEVYDDTIDENILEPIIIKLVESVQNTEVKTCMLEITDIDN